MWVFQVCEQHFNSLIELLYSNCSLSLTHLRRRTTDYVLITSIPRLQSVWSCFRLLALSIILFYFIFFFSKSKAKKEFTHRALHSPPPHHHREKRKNDTIIRNWELNHQIHLCVSVCVRAECSIHNKFSFTNSTFSICSTVCVSVCLCSNNEEYHLKVHSTSIKRDRHTNLVWSSF